MTFYLVFKNISFMFIVQSIISSCTHASKTASISCRWSSASFVYLNLVLFLMFLFCLNSKPTSHFLKLILRQLF